MDGLLGLKQQQAGVVQAREAVRQAEEVLRQGRSIMLFTVITIVFVRNPSKSNFDDANQIASTIVWCQPIRHEPEDIRRFVDIAQRNVLHL